MRNPFTRVRYWKTGKNRWHKVERTFGRVDRDHRCHWDPDRYREVKTLPPDARTCKFCMANRFPQ